MRLATLLLPSLLSPSFTIVSGAPSFTIKCSAPSFTIVHHRSPSFTIVSGAPSCIIIYHRSPSFTIISGAPSFTIVQQQAPKSAFSRHNKNCCHLTLTHMPALSYIYVCPLQFSACSFLLHASRLSLHSQTTAVCIKVVPVLNYKLHITNYTL